MCVMCNDKKKRKTLEMYKISDRTRKQSLFLQHQNKQK